MGRLPNTHRIVPLLLVGGLRGLEYLCLVCNRPLYLEIGKTLWRHHPTAQQGWNGLRVRVQ